MAAEIIAVRGHYEVYVNGQFCGSADTYKEAEEMIQSEV